MTTGHSVWLYGSHARGDHDDMSDVDILAVGSWAPLPPTVLAFPRERLSVSEYSKPELERMAEYGSLFLHHISQEGKELSGAGWLAEWIRGTLAGLTGYSRAEQDLASFRATLADVNRSTDCAACSPLFEMAVVATVARHASVLGCYLLGAPTFGRRAPFERIADLLHWKDAAYFHKLYLFRLHEDGRARAPFAANVGDVRAASSRAADLIDAIEEART